MLLESHAEQVDALERENEKLRKINAVLIERVERASDGQGSAFALFQRSIVLEKIVRERTAELQAANAAIREAQFTAERANLGKTKFFAAAGHDLLQPLHAARLFVSALKGLEEQTERAREIVRRIDAALADAEHLLSTTLEISKLDAGVLTAEVCDFNLGTLLQRLADESTLQAEERGLRLRVVPADVIVRSDPQLIARVVRNFLSNALRYTERGGLVLGCRLRAGICRVEVWDTGVGIPAERLGTIFEEFRQYEVPGRGRDGMGLGLAIVERIARLLEARIDVKSTVGRGSVFSIDVPVGERTACVASDVDEGPGDGANLLAGRTGLVIDDDPAARSAMAAVLRGWGCEALEAWDTASAVAGTRALSRPLDFIIADYHLGQGETGLDAIESLRRAPRGAIPALVVTSDATAETRTRVTAFGYPMLAKPVRPDRLRSLVNHWFAASPAPGVTLRVRRR